MSASGGKTPGYEPKDTNFGALVMLIGLLFILLGGILIVARHLDRLFTRYSAVHDQPESPMSDMRRLPPEPRLQVDPAVDLIRMRDVENVTLNNYAWIDSDAGKVRIPIARAMAILAESRLPARKRQE